MSTPKNKNKNLDPGYPGPGRKSEPGGSSEPVGRGNHQAHLLEADVSDGPTGHASDPVHVRAPRALNPRRLVEPIGVRHLGPASHNEQTSARAEIAQVESTEQNIPGQQHLARRRADLWNEREVATLRALCSTYEDRPVQWNTVFAEFNRLHGYRTKGALATKWRTVKKLTVPGVNITPQPPDLSRADLRSDEGEGNEAVTSQPADPHPNIPIATADEGYANGRIPEPVIRDGQNCQSAPSVSLTTTGNPRDCLIDMQGDRWPLRA